MGMVFASNDKKSIRLNNTVCMYKGVPCLVTCRDYEMGNPLTVSEVYVSPLVDYPVNWPDRKVRGMYRVTYTTPDFDYRSTELGYMNYSNNAYYMYRLPVREYQAGHSPSNVQAHEVRPFPYHEWWGTTNFGSCVLGKHPTFDQALAAVMERENAACAFHRHFALVRMDRKRCTLEHRGTTIGIRSPVTGTFRLFPNKGYRALKCDLEALKIPHILENEA